MTAILCVALVLSAAALTVSDAERAALDRISAQSLEEHLSFIASDKLGGRATPSPGLDAAADFIAESFQRAGLEPGIAGGYFQQGLARNVVGILRGSDPQLRDTCVVLSAHYDHLGTQRGRIYHGANDDGSGTVSVMEVAAALAAMSPHPKRSIVFATFYGEETGETGSRYFVNHPVCASTIADLNLEQLGRTDSTEGTRRNSAALTGFDFTDISRVVAQAGKATGVRIYDDLANGDHFFEMSDNVSFAEKGIPATTLAVTFMFPDYHEPGDTWQKIDYANMAKVDRAVALAVILLANADEPPHWIRNNPKVRSYVNASANHARPAIPAK